MIIFVVYLNYLSFFMQRTFSFNIPPLFSLIIFLILGYFLFSIMKYVYLGLLFAAPVLITAIILGKKEILFNYFRRLFSEIKKKPFPGTLNALVSIFFLPFSLVGMLASAFFTRKIEQIQQTGSQGFFESSKESEYTDFVDLSGEETKERKTISEWDVEKWDNKFK